MLSTTENTAKSRWPSRWLPLDLIDGKHNLQEHWFCRSKWDVDFYMWHYGCGWLVRRRQLLRETLSRKRLDGIHIQIRSPLVRNFDSVSSPSSFPNVHPTCCAQSDVQMFEADGTCVFSKVWRNSYSRHDHFCWNHTKVCFSKSSSNMVLTLVQFIT